MELAYLSVWDDLGLSVFGRVYGSVFGNASAISRTHSFGLLTWNRLNGLGRVCARLRLGDNNGDWLVRGVCLLSDG